MPEPDAPDRPTDLAPTDDEVLALEQLFDDGADAHLELRGFAERIRRVADTIRTTRVIRDAEAAIQLAREPVGGPCQVAYRVPVNEGAHARPGMPLTVAALEEARSRLLAREDPYRVDSWNDEVNAFAEKLGELTEFVTERSLHGKLLAVVLTPDLALRFGITREGGRLMTACGVVTVRVEDRG